jgi:hypothetical protein
MTGAAPLCGHCGARLAAPEDTLRVAGRHAHEVRNRAGLQWTVHCFARAAGAVASGPATDEETWFSGHTWQRLFCRQCSRHVGWLFRAKSQTFAALIAPG